MHTTLNKIREKEPCVDGWEKLLRALNKTKADDEPLSLITILDSNGLADALWCLRAVDGYDREMRLLAVGYARQVQHLMKDQKSLDALDIAERFANGQATQQELKAARSDACDVADSASAAALAAMSAAIGAASDAAWGAMFAAGAVAREAAKSEQEVMFREMFGEKVEQSE